MCVYVIHFPQLTVILMTSMKHIQPKKHEEEKTLHMRPDEWKAPCVCVEARLVKALLVIGFYFALKSKSYKLRYRRGGERSCLRAAR